MVLSTVTCLLVHVWIAYHTVALVSEKHTVDTQKRGVVGSLAAVISALIVVAIHCNVDRRPEPHLLLNLLDIFCS